MPTGAFSLWTPRLGPAADSAYPSEINRETAGTADEFKAVAQGVLSYFGTYSLDDRGKMLTQHIKGSSFPNLGANRIWAIALTGDELTIGSQAGAAGGTNELKWKRVK